jgi:excisionase family DNA binding protein
MQMKTCADNLLTATEAAAQYRVQSETIIRLAVEGKFKAFKIGKLWRIDRASLERYLESTATQTTK